MSYLTSEGKGKGSFAWSIFMGTLHEALLLWIEIFVTPSVYLSLLKLRYTHIGNIQHLCQVLFWQKDNSLFCVVVKLGVF